MDVELTVTLLVVVVEDDVVVVDDSLDAVVVIVVGLTDEVEFCLPSLFPSFPSRVEFNGRAMVEVSGWP